MANYDRGVYQPSDEVRVFDGSEEEDDVEGSRLPLLIVLALLVLAMFAGVVWLAYTQGVARGRGETPVLTAAAGPERVAPPASGGGTVPYQGFKIYEQPAPSDDSADSGAPAPPAAKPVTEAPQAKAAPEAAPKAAAVTAPPPAAVKSPPAAPPRSVAGLIQQANSEPPKSAPAAKAPAAAANVKSPPPAMKQAMIPPPPSSAVATAAPRPLGTPAPAAPAPKVAAATPAPASPAAGDGYVLQIGSYKSQAEAAAAWNQFKRRHAALLAGYSDDIRQADLGEKGTWYRLRVAGFADREVAVAVCDRLKADGGACILGR